MEKQLQYIFLPADKPSNIYLTKDGVLHLGTLSGSSTPHTFNQHLYILSDDGIKEGDWMIDRNYGKPSQLIEDSDLVIKARPYIKNQCKKIIATTNPELWEKWTSTLYGTRKVEDGVAKISPSDIEYIINLYNEKDAEELHLEDFNFDAIAFELYKSGKHPAFKVNADKKFTLEQVGKVFKEGIEFGMAHSDGVFGDDYKNKMLNRITESLIQEQPKRDTIMVEYEKKFIYIDKTETLAKGEYYKLKTKDGCIVISRG